MKSNRDAYGEILRKYGEDSRVVVLDADVSSSTKTGLFREKYPERFYNFGIAEMGMTSAACGMAIEGKIPFVNCFAVFASSLALLPVRSLAGYMNLNVRIAGAYGGLSDSFDGATHQSVEDVAIMRAIPNMTVLTASDNNQTDWIIKEALTHRGPMYIRLSRDALPDVYKEGEQFELGRGKTVRGGSDCTIIANGRMLAEALKAADALAQENISARVVDMFCIKPLDTELVRRCAAETKAVVTVEEHSVIGGLGSAVGEALAEYDDPRARFRRIGLKDAYGRSGAYASLLEYYGLTAGHIVSEVKSIL